MVCDISRCRYDSCCNRVTRWKFSIADESCFHNNMVELEKEMVDASVVCLRVDKLKHYIYVIMYDGKGYSCAMRYRFYSPRHYTKINEIFSSQRDRKVFDDINKKDITLALRCSVESIMNTIKKSYKKGLVGKVYASQTSCDSNTGYINFCFNKAQRVVSAVLIRRCNRSLQTQMYAYYHNIINVLIGVDKAISNNEYVTSENEFADVDTDYMTK
jgi:hypothetical protein